MNERIIIDKDASNVYCIQLFNDNSWRVHGLDGKRIDGADAMWLMPKKYKDAIKEKVSDERLS
jgi:hypothetical protein